MKRKDSTDKKNKAQAFLNKYQLGGFNADDTLMQNPYDYAPDLQTAQMQQLVQFNDPKNQQAYVTPQNTQQGWDTAIPLISPAINLGIGIKSIIDSFGERKRQKQYERAYKRDLTRRMGEARTNDFYVTPYGIPGTNYGSYERGGSIPDRYKNMGFNKVDTPKRTPNAFKSHAVVVKVDDKYKLIRFGQQGVSGSPEREGESESDRKRREAFKARHQENINKGKSSAAYWADKVKWQQGGLYNPNQSDQFDFFLDFYNQKEKENQLKQQSFQDWYTSVNQQKEAQWRDKQKTGIKNALSGAMDIAKTIAGMPSFQQGGLVDSLMQRSSTDTKLANLTSDYFNLYQPDTTTNDSIDAERASYIWNYKKDNPEMFDMLMGLSPDRPKPSKSKRFYKNEREKQDGGTQEYNPKVDLYSPEYDPTEFLGIENELAAAQVEDKEASVIESWLFQDEPELDELNLDYFNPEPTTSTSNSSLDVISNIEALESGGNPEAINPTSGAVGLFQFLPRYWSGQIKSFMGLPQTFTQEQVMQVFKKNEKVQRDFMNHVVNDIYMPEVEKLRPLAKKYGLSDDKIIKLLHYRGISDAKKRLQTGDFTVSTEEKAKYKNPDILTYLNK